MGFSAFHEQRQRHTGKQMARDWKELRVANRNSTLFSCGLLSPRPENGYENWNKR